MADQFGLRLFMRWANAFHKPVTGFRAQINLHADNNERAARAWWSTQLNLSISDFNKSFVKPAGTGHRKNHLEFGVCSVTKRKCADAFHATTAWIEFLQEALGR